MEIDTEVKQVETHNWLKTSSTSCKRQMLMLQEGHILIGSAKYKGKKVYLWLSRIPELEEIKCAQ